MVAPGLFATLEGMPFHGLEYPAHKTCKALESAVAEIGGQVLQVGYRIVQFIQDGV